MYTELFNSIKSFFPDDIVIRLIMVAAALVIMWGFNRVFYKQESN